MENGGGQANDWRLNLHPSSRQKIVTRIIDTLHRLPAPIGDQHNLLDLAKIARRFEEKRYNAAIDQQDYLMTISLKMLALGAMGRSYGERPAWIIPGSCAKRIERRIQAEVSKVPRPERKLSWRQDGLVPRTIHQQHETRSKKQVTEDLCGDGGAGDLIPGMPNDVVLQHVVPRLPWDTMFVLTAVNQPWRKAIRSREVHQWKKDSSLTELLVVNINKEGRRHVLYDIERNRAYLLPPYPPPFEENSVPYSVVLDGKIFVIGNLRIICETGLVGAVLVLDIVGCQGVWACFPHSRAFRISDVFTSCDGKIFASNRWSVVPGGVFDTENNEWKPIPVPPETEEIKCYQIANLAKDIFFFSIKELEESFVAGHPAVHDTETGKIVVYNIETQTWRTFETPSPYKEGRLCVINGALYNFRQKHVQVFSAESNTWSDFQPISTSHVAATHPFCVIPVGGEVLAILECSRNTTVCQSVGFGVEGKPLVWTKVACPPFREWSQYKGESGGYYLCDGYVDF